jgi:hypothetical protein
MRKLILVVSSLLIAGLTAPAQAISIQYDVIALGGNQYRYDYSITNDGSLGSGTAIQLFDILFDPANFLESSLTISTPSPLAQGWDQLILASAPGVPAAYDALATAGGIADGSTVGGFAVEFTWIGTGLPGSQPFAIYDPSTFDLLSEGTTTSVVPTPAAAWLLGSGLAVLLGFISTDTNHVRTTARNKKEVES